MAVDAVASLVRALDDGKIDNAAHTLLLLLGDPLGVAQLRRFAAMERAVAKVGEQLTLQRAVALDAGVAPATEEMPLSYSQLQMFTLQTMAPQSSAYNIVRAVRVAPSTPLDLKALHATCDALLTKHDVLRTVFSTDVYGEPRQRVMPLHHFKRASKHSGGDERSLVRVLEIDQETLSNDDALAKYISGQTATPFDLASEAPLRFYAVTSPDSTRGWALAVAMHHIVTDPESTAVFWDDVGTFYTKFRRENPQDELSQLVGATRQRVSYRDYAHWQRQRLQSGLLAHSLQYWIDQLSHDDIPQLELPYDRPPPQASASHTQDRRGGAVVFQSTPQLQKQLNGLCAAQGASMFIGLMAVFHMLLSRVANCDDIVIGAPTSGRSHEALHGLMGYFVNTLPFRLKAQHDSDFAGFLRSVKDVVLDGLSHMDVPLQKMLEHVQLERTTAQHSVFQVMFAWEDREAVTQQQQQQQWPLELQELALPHATAKFDLMLTMRNATNGDGLNVLEGSLEYAADVFDRTTVERFAQYFLELATQVVRAPESTKLSEIQMVPEAERRQLLRDWGSPRLVSAASATESALFLDECVQRQVEHTPQNVALRFEGREWTYRQLWQHSSRLAAALQRDAGEPQQLVGARVGLFVDRGLENVASIVGVLQARAVFIPLDPEFPVDRIQYMLEDSEAEVVVTQRHLAAKLAELLARSPRRDAIRVLICEDAFNAGSEDPSVETAGFDGMDPADATAYILYTSGSTGRPKGVMVTHANLLTTLRWTVREYAVTHDDIFLQSTSSTLDGSLTQLFSPLLAGASALVTKKNGLHDLAYLAGLLSRHRVTFCVFVPSYFAMLIDFMGAFPQHVKHVVLAGEAFPTALAAKFYSKHARLCEASQTRVSATCLVNEYGPTEASVTSTFFRYPCELALCGGGPDKQQQQQSVPIGRGVDDHFLVVLDKHKRLVPVNVPGELYVGGRGVAKGYWNRAELTDTTFRHDELRWIHESGELVQEEGNCTPLRWYKTGDLVKWLPCGELLFLGRTDSQVKLRGMRIELQEVRNVLLQSAQVKDAEVLVVDQRLVAYVILATSGSGEIAALREFLGTRLPVHMVPHEILVVGEWPRTPNGKLDLRALAQFTAPAVAKPEAHSNNQHEGENDDTGGGGDSADAGSTVLVDILRQAWREVLDVDDEAALTRASFFELGGNSLSAIRVISLVKPHGLALKLESFFRCKSLLEMAATCASTLAAEGCPTHKSTVIPLNWRPWTDGSGGGVSPLFLIHCADGTVWKMMELARRLPCPVFGLQATHGGTAESVEQLAAKYWAEIRAVQRSGMYRIGGFSFGCRVAHAVAALGLQEGAVFEPLTLLDGIPFHFADRQRKPQEDGERPEDEDDAETNVTEYVARALGYKPSPQQPQDGAGRADHARDPERELFEQLVANYASHCALDNLYRPCDASGRKPLVGPIAARLFKTTRWDVDVAAYRARGVEMEVIPIDGEHLTMLRVPHVDSVARAVAAAQNCER